MRFRGRKVLVFIVISVVVLLVWVILRSINPPKLPAEDDILILLDNDGNDDAIILFDGRLGVIVSLIAGVITIIRTFS